MSVSACFENFIGTSRDCENESISGLYLTDLEGITLETAANVANGEQKKGTTLLNNCIEMGINLTMSDLSRYTNQYFKFNSVIDHLYAGEFTSNYLPFVGFKRGLTLRKTRQNMQRLVLKRVDILVRNTVQNKVIEIQDFFYPYTYSNTQIPYKTTAITIPELEAGKIYELHLNYVAIGNEVRIVMDNNNAQVNEGLFNASTGGSCCGSTMRTAFSSKDITVYGWNGVTTEGRTFGMRAEALVECDETALFCALKDKLKYLFLYKAGLEFVKRWLFSDRLSRETVLELERAKAETLRKLFDSEYKERYEMAANNIRAWLTSYDCPCISCKGYSYDFVTG